jgi:integrase
MSVSNIITLPQRRRASPSRVNGKVMPPIRRRNAETRTREYLTAAEVQKLIKAASRGRYGQRDAALVLMAFRHGLRVTELVSLRWDAVDWVGGNLHVARVKNGTPSTHPIRGLELRALRQLRRDWPDSPYLFVTERGGPLSTSNVRKIVARLGVAAKLGFPAHPHQLRHATGYALANKGVDTRSLQAYLGHRSIASTTVYTDTAPGRFKDFWHD